jgi:hypothetical protein
MFPHGSILDGMNKMNGIFPPLEKEDFVYPVHLVNPVPKTSFSRLSTSHRPLITKITCIPIYTWYNPRVKGAQASAL